MNNNTLFCGIALVVVGLVSFFADSPTWDKRVNKYLDAHDAAVDKYAEEKSAGKDVKEPVPNKKVADYPEEAKEKKLKKDPGKLNFTALIPSGLGVLLLAAVAVVIYRPQYRKHAMHAAAVVGAVAVVGGLFALFGGVGDFNLLSGWSGPSLTEFWPTAAEKVDAKVSVWDQPKVRSGVIVAVIGAIYVALAVKSFIDARKAQAAQQPAA